jgi:hypothetical protein
MMEIISNKSDKNMSLKNKNTISYKSVSEISEFEEYDEEEPSDFGIRTKKNKSCSQHSKLNESLHSVNSHISNTYEEKYDEDNYLDKKKNNI